MAAAPALAWFYHEPALSALTIAMAGTSLVIAVGTQHQALLQRNMRLGTAAVIRLVAQILGGSVAIAALAAVWLVERAANVQILGLA